MKPIRVLMLLPSLRVANGVASFAMTYFLCVDPKEIHIDFVVYSDYETPYYEIIKERGSKIYVLPSLKMVAKHFSACNEILKNGHYDIVHDNTLHVSLPMMMCAKKQKINVRILHSHSSKMGETPIKEIRNNIFMPLLLSLATDYIACSKIAGEAMFKRKQFTVLPNVIDPEKFCFDNNIRNKIRNEMGVGQKKVVCTIGRLSPPKNPFYAIDIIAKLKEKDNNIEYWWIGSGPLDLQVKEYIDSKKLSGFIKLLGSKDNVSDFYNAVDCIFAPSLFEGLPITVIESQAMGLPVVASNVIPKEVVYTDLVEFIDLKESYEIWINQLEKSLDKKPCREKYNKELKNSKYSNINCGEKLISIYKELMNKKAKGAFD